MGGVKGHTGSTVLSLCQQVNQSAATTANFHYKPDFKLQDKAHRPSATRMLQVIFCACPDTYVSFCIINTNADSARRGGAGEGLWSQ